MSDPDNRVIGVNYVAGDARNICQENNISFVTPAQNEKKPVTARYGPQIGLLASLNSVWELAKKLASLFY